MMKVRNQPKLRRVLESWPLMPHLRKMSRNEIEDAVTVVYLICSVLLCYINGIQWVKFEFDCNYIAQLSGEGREVN